MRGFIGKMILATTEEQGKLVEEEKGKNPVQYEHEEKTAFLP
jgi:hypothetical protein